MILTPQQFFARYHVSAAYTNWRRAHPHPDDLEEAEAFIAPLVATDPPPFANTLPLTDEMDHEEFDDEPEWMQDFDPWILEAIRVYEMEEQR